MYSVTTAIAYRANEEKILNKGGDFIYTIINRISIAVILLILALFLVDKSILGFNFIGVIPFVCFFLVIIYINKLEEKAEIDKKVKIIGWICFCATVFIGLLLILSLPEIFNTYRF
ncbi:hypothetical protein [Alkalihalobacterium chitinilyticum]|uniref:DUF4181 domain-containing protein n=1 Tax=Alkalihalobacterium chitinilyticum TaxID=2980103 RepID=A0ABT5VNH5_9BACI|nr:hypothetical protein [Alkalihalobacterium chitinilyticum]MDE5416038.1 hypothetical protein [Alkalihalobacterium chitinilyticum]